MANSHVLYTGTGDVANFSVTFPFLDRDHVIATVDGASAAFSWINDTTVAISPTPTNGALVELSRATPSDEPLVDFQDGALVSEDELDTVSRQAVYLAQETDYKSTEALLLANEAIDNLRVIQDEDGLGLRDGVVQPGSFSPEALMLIGGWNPRGAWVTGTVYAARDMVTVDDVNYVTLVGHTSAATFSLDLAKWQGVGPARPSSRYVSVKWFGAVGDAVQALNGAWSGTDNSTAFRNAWLFAVALGLDVYIPRGNYIVTEQIVASGEATSNTCWYGDGPKTVIIPHTGDKGSSFRLFSADGGNLLQDGLNTGTPTFYFTAPVTAGSSIAEVSTVAGLTVGWWVQIIDRKSRTRFFDSQPTGVGSGASVGQVAKVVAVSDGGTSTYALAALEYNSANGLTTVTVSEDTCFVVGSSISVSALTGEGAVASLNGTYTTTSGAPGQKIITFTATTGLGDITATSGTITFVGDGTPRVVFSPAFEFDYPGTNVSPNTASTCLRRYPSLREGVTFRDMKFVADRTAPPISTQVILYVSNLVDFRVRDIHFEWSGRCLNTNGSINWEISGCSFTKGNRENYYVNIGNAASYGRIFNCFAQNGRHFVQGTTDGDTVGPAHIRVTNCIAAGQYWTPFASHGAQRDWIFDNVTAIAPIGEQGGDGFQLRGTRMTMRNCTSIGGTFGVEIAFGADCVVDGGTFINCLNGIRIHATLRPRIINYPIIRNSRESHIRIMPEGFAFVVTSGTYDDGTGEVVLNVADEINFSPGSSITVASLTGTGTFSGLNGVKTSTGVSGTKVVRFTAATGLGAITLTGGAVSAPVAQRGFFPGVFITARVDGRPSRGDIAWLTQAPNTPLTLGDDLRINIDAISRAPVITVWDENNIDVATVKFPTERYLGLGTKTASFSVVPYLNDILYFVDTTSGAVTATLPGVVSLSLPAVLKVPGYEMEGMRVSFKKINSGGDAATIATPGSETIEGSASDYTLTDLATVHLRCHNGAWWLA